MIIWKNGVVRRPQKGALLASCINVMRSEALKTEDINNEKYTMKVHFTIWIVLITTLTFGQGNIFSPGKTYLYAVEYTADAITTTDTVKIQATGRPWRVDPEKQL